MECYNSPPLKLDFVLEMIPYHSWHAKQLEQHDHNPEHTPAFPRQLKPTLPGLYNPQINESLTT